MKKTIRILFLMACMVYITIASKAQYTDLDKYKSFNKIEKQLIKTRIAFDTPDSSVYAHVMEYDAKVNPVESKFYYWYKAGQIKRSRGGFDGRLLHGKYSAFFFNKNLKEKGNYTKGLKSGLWLTWHPNGELKISAHWSGGYLSGKYATWDESGKLQSKGNYLKDKKQGKWSFYQPDGSFMVKKYKKDVEIIGKKSKPLWGNLFKKKVLADTLQRPTKVKPQKTKPVSTNTIKSTKQVKIDKPKDKSAAKDSTSKKKPPFLFQKDVSNEYGAK